MAWISVTIAAAQIAAMTRPPAGYRSQ